MKVTREMADKARENLYAHGVTAQEETVHQALEAALADVPDPGFDVRYQALVKATEAVDAAQSRAKELSGSSTNSRGYADRYTAPTLLDRTSAILDLAKFLTGDLS